MVRGTFSPPGRWRPAVVARLARTLGNAEMQHTSTASSTCFSTRRPAGFSLVAARKSDGTPADLAEPEGTANTDSGTGFALAKAVDGQGHQQAAVAHGREEEHSVSHRHHRAAPTLARMQSPCSQPRGARNTTRFFGSRAAVATWPTPCLHVPRNSPHSQLRGPAPALPNPSVNRSANGRPPAPGRWYAVHFHRPGAGVLPSSPGYLER